MTAIVQKNRLVFQPVTLLLLAFLTACAAEKPQGADIEGLTRIGDTLRARGDDAGAADFYTRALQRKPTDTRARLALAGILESRGDFATAGATYREGLQLEPTNADFLRGYGRALIRLGQPAEAKEQYERVLQLDSDDIKAMNGLGVALDYLGQHDAAQNTYKKALDEKPDDLVTLSNLAHSYVLGGSYDTAIKLLEPHARDPNAPPALRQNLAEAYGMAGMDVDAERMARLDLPMDQVKKNLAFYRARRLQLTPSAMLYADLGDFATEAMAQNYRDEISGKFSAALGGLSLAVVPDVKAIGGTPVFNLRATGFSKPAKLRAFCDRLKKEKTACKVKG